MSENPCPVWTSAFICERAQKTSVYVSMQMQAYGTCEYVEEKGQSLSVSFLWWPRSINCFLSTETITPKLYCRSSTSCWIANNHIFYFPKKPTSQWQVHDQSKILKTNKTERLWIQSFQTRMWYLNASCQICFIVEPMQNREISRYTNEYVHSVRGMCEVGYIINYIRNKLNQHDTCISWVFSYIKRNHSGICTSRTMTVASFLYRAQGHSNVSNVLGYWQPLSHTPNMKWG